MALTFHSKAPRGWPGTIHPFYRCHSCLPGKGFWAQGFLYLSGGCFGKSLPPAVLTPFPFPISCFHLFLIILNRNDSKSTYTQNEILVVGDKEFRSKCACTGMSRKGNWRVGRCCWTKTCLIRQPAQHTGTEAFEFTWHFQTCPGTNVSLCPMIVYPF